ncbi:MAG: Uma2 family endonuclease [Chloroflexaceae bacterium]|nr:Uma2 family endonuclease [Chloroflexaceae bacterium]
MTRPDIDISSTTEQRIKMSYTEFLAYVDEDAHAEWVDGEALIFMPPKTRHQLLVNFFQRILAQYAELVGAGVVITAPFEMKLRPDGNSREPDMLFVATEHLARLTDERLAGPADIVVEVVSPSSVQRDYADKFLEYQQAGVREYWIIDPREGVQQVYGYTLAAEGHYQPIAADAEGRSASTVLAGFWLRPAWLWQESAPTVFDVMMEMAPHALRSTR